MHGHEVGVGGWCPRQRLTYSSWPWGGGRGAGQPSRAQTYMRRPSHAVDRILHCRAQSLPHAAGTVATLVLLVRASSLLGICCCC